MGLNSTIIIRNDCLCDIENDPDFGKKVAQAIQGVTGRGPTDISSGCSVNAATVVETHHADGFKVILVGGNTAYDLGYGGNTMELNPNEKEDLKEILNTVLRDRGMKVWLEKPVLKVRQGWPGVKRVTPMDPWVDTERRWGEVINTIRIDTKSEWYQIMEDMISSGERLVAIKHLRNNAGLGLKESKDFLDKYYPYEGDLGGGVTVLV